MTTSILNDALLLKNDPQGLQDYFLKINILLFEDIFKESKTQQEASQKILYILCGYSEDSPLIILRQDSKDEKEGICEYLQIPEYLREKLYGLTEKTVKKATTSYLERFAGQEFKTLMFLKIQLADQERDITNGEFTSKKDEIIYMDVKERGRAIQECRRLASETDKMEKSIKGKLKYIGIENMREWIARAIKSNSASTNGTYRGSGLEHSDLIK